MVVLHIGAPKTGTTAVQDFLAENDGRLPGLVNPPVLRGARARQLRAYARYPHLDSRDAQLLDLTRAGLPAFVERYEARVRAALAAAGDRRVVACNELLFDLDDAAVERVASLFAPHHLTVVVYLRRHVELAASRYLQARKRGLRRRSVLPAHPPGNRPAIERWGRVGDVVVRLYDRREMPGGDVRRDVLQALGVEPGPDVVWPDLDANPSWGRLQTLVGDALRARVPRPDPAPTPRQERARQRALLAYLQRLPYEPQPVLSRPAAAAYLDRFAADDEWVRQRFFPDRPALFSADVDAYPQTLPRARLTRDEALEALAELWRFRTDEVTALQAQVDELRAREGWGHLPLAGGAAARLRAGRAALRRLRRRGPVSPSP